MNQDIIMVVGVTIPGHICGRGNHIKAIMVIGVTIPGYNGCGCNPTRI